MEDTRFIGVDLAWREDSADFVANETGLAIVGGDGQILDAGWTCGLGLGHRLSDERS